MSRFNLRPISAPVAIPPPVIQDKKPSAYAAMNAHKQGDVISHVSLVAEPIVAKKRGRPSKQEVKKKRLEMASQAIGMLIVSKPTKGKVCDYMAQRVMELDEEKK